MSGVLLNSSSDRGRGGLNSTNSYAVEFSELPKVKEMWKPPCYPQTKHLFFHSIFHFREISLCKAIGSMEEMNHWSIEGRIRHHNQACKGPFSAKPLQLSWDNVIPRTTRSYGVKRISRNFGTNRFRLRIPLLHHHHHPDHCSRPLESLIGCFFISASSELWTLRSIRRRSFRPLSTTPSPLRREHF